MDKHGFAQWVRDNNEREIFRCKKDQVYVLSCGTKTYTWIIDQGVLFTTKQAESGEGELANSIWRADDMVHSLDDDIMLTFRALTDCELARYSSQELNAQIRSNPDMSWYLANYYHNQFTKTLASYHHAVLDSSEERLMYLEKMFDGIEELKGERISDATLASFMGMHRVSVSRIRKKIADSSK